MNQEVYKKRIIISGFIILLVSLLLAVKLANLHFSGKITVEKKKNPDVIRGYIRDRNRDILALSMECSSLYANTEEMANHDDAAALLSPIIRIPRDTLAEKLKRKKRFIWIKRKLTDEEAIKIRKLGIKGLDFKREYRRFYPNDRLASNVIGFVGVDNRGLEGIEFKFEPNLSGSELNESGIVSDELKTGNTVILTIDRFVQYTAEKAIEKSVKENRAKQGSVMVMEVKTGNILALAKYPLIDPNNYHAFNETEGRNFSVTDSFEPGSTLKIFAAAAMIEANPDILNKTFICKGSIDLYDTVINCTSNHGRVDLRKSIRYSCNVGMIEAAKSLGKEKLYGMLKKFKFGDVLNTKIPGEAEGILRDHAAWSGLSRFSITIGHELSVTSLQMAAAVSAIANRGIYIYPAIIQSIEDENGFPVKKSGAIPGSRIISENTANIVMEMMRDVVENGTGALASPNGYPAAGKTGTSQKYSRKVREYSDRVISSFIGVVPYDNPEVCIYVVIDDPSDREHGGRIAAPVFRDVAERILPYMGVKKGIDRKFDPVKIMQRDASFDGRIMPDFTGMGPREAIALLSDMKKRAGHEFTVSGTGRVIVQKPAPGTALIKNQPIQILMDEDGRNR